MSRIFARRAKLTVGSLQVESEGEFALRVAFSVQKSTHLSENSARIQIYNLSEDTRKRLSEESDRLSERGVLRRLVLEAGYQDDVRQIFAGDRAWVGHSRQGTDWITTIESLDGAKALKTQVSLSFQPNTVATDIVQELKKQALLAWDQLKGGDVQQALDSLVFGSGKTLSGSVGHSLNQIADEAGLEVSVQDGELLFHAHGGESPTTSLVLTAESGLVGTPEVFLDPSRRPKKKSGKAKNSPFSQNANLVRGKALLNGLLAPGRRFVLDSRSAVANAGATFGVFRVIRVHHQGDTHGGDESWLSSWEAEEASQAA